MHGLPSQSAEFVYVPVPADRVAEVYALLAQAASPKGLVDAERLRLLERIYRESDVAFRRLLRYLSDRPDRPVRTEKVAEDLELPRGASSLAGMLGAFARRSKNRYEGYTPIETTYNPVRDATELVMAQADAEAVEEVLRRYRKRPVKPKRKPVKSKRD